jgi:hypothetical protein
MENISQKKESKRITRKARKERLKEFDNPRDEASSRGLFFCRKQKFIESKNTKDASWKKSLSPVWEQSIR